MSWISFLIFGIILQVTFSAYVINRGDNVNNDDDETPTTPLPPNPPIQHQFQVVSSRLTDQSPQQPIRQVVETPSSQSVEEPKKTEDTDDTEDTGVDEDGDKLTAQVEGSEEQLAEGRDLSSQRNTKKSVKQGTFQQAVGCGYFRMKGGQAISIQSTNFNSGGTYRNYEQCTWKFFGQQCIVKASCPRFNLPSTPDCLGDNLKVTDLYSFAHKFCGDSRPLGTYNSTTNNLKIRFRSDGQTSDSGEGFLCCVTCTGPGRQDPIQLSNSTACSTTIGML